MSQHAPHLLIVDDDERIRSLLQKFLIRNGFLVTAARDAAHARRLLAGLEFSLIVLDVMMPGMDGPSTLKQLQQQFDLSQVPVVFMTAKVQSSEIESYKALGASDVVVKPFDPMTLSEQIRQIWQRQQR